MFAQIRAGLNATKSKFWKWNANTRLSGASDDWWKTKLDTYLTLSHSVILLTRTVYFSFRCFSCSTLFGIVFSAWQGHLKNSSTHWIIQSQTGFIPSQVFTAHFGEEVCWQGSVVLGLVCLYHSLSKACPCFLLIPALSAWHYKCFIIFPFSLYCLSLWFEVFWTWSALNWNILYPAYRG